MLVHLASADLDLERLFAGPDDRRVQRAVQVVFRRCDVVVELARNIRPQAVDDAERRVTIGERRYDDAYRPDVVELVER
jgi:hypothetical protein